MPIPLTSARRLDRLHAGDIDLDGYLDLLVGNAIAHLRGLPSIEQRALRMDLRDRLQSDPALIELVEMAARSSRGSR